MKSGSYGQLILTRDELKARGPNDKETYNDYTQVIFHQPGGSSYLANIGSIPLRVNFFIPGDPQVYQLIAGSG